MLIEQDMMVSWEERDDAAMAAKSAKWSIMEANAARGQGPAGKDLLEFVDQRPIMKTRRGRMIALAMAPVSPIRAGFIALVVPNEGPMVMIDPTLLTQLPSVKANRNG